MSSSYGTIFKLSTFGESHGITIGGIIDGVPSNVSIDLDAIQADLDRRKPGQSEIVTQRKESDKVQILSGLFEGKTTGTSIGFIIPNDNQKSKDYDHIKEVYRPSHADFTYDKKYGNRDYRGGGRSSARETACRVVAGSIAKQILELKGIDIVAYVDQVGSVKLTGEVDYNEIENNSVRCPNVEDAAKMESLIKEIKKAGDTIGGSIVCEINHVPPGLGEPVFDKLHADLGKAMLSINAVKGFEYGSGFDCIEMKGSDHNDLFNEDGSTQTNHSGGIQGGISNGMVINMRIAFKPVATLIQKQQTLNAKDKIVEMQGKGRHDPCVVPRAVAIVEAMAAITILDFYLLHNSRIDYPDKRRE
ncbi:chorismate synthase [Crocinitomicaceae bacterium]|nr:chorismate synthase [Crocinitomicaceae bacterium]MDC0099688.1 chorismate synthase [Crocinitomicaceae bacterium]MDC1385195.1 chorismate synthase [Crocinitomicaceae bacterium]|tara:strand:+ start:1638 stop:2717 length:1080 start_codon:yes stop_codon:yes gene_type:complete